ncbi:MAG: hypothetical protein JWL64_1531 [Frankiales bacterium]|nr:hypothetical protein [Frankiales bacterium]
MPLVHRIQTAPLRRRSNAQLLAMQLEAVRAWNRSRGARLHELERAIPQQDRASRSESTRRLAALRASHHALLARADQALSDADRLLWSDRRPRAVLVHRSVWLRDQLAAALECRGVWVIASLGDGADAVGTVVCEQPELLITEDVVPLVSGLDLASETAEYSVATIVGVQTSDNRSLGAFVDAGARAWFTRQSPPDHIADQCVRLLGHPDRPETVGGPQPPDVVTLDGVGAGALEIDLRSGSVLAPARRPRSPGRRGLPRGRSSAGTSDQTGTGQGTV